MSHVISDLKIDLVPVSEEELEFPTDQRIYAIASAFKAGMSVEKVHQLTKIDRWFLSKLNGLITLEKRLSTYKPSTLNESILRESKQKGFSDKQIARIVSSTELAVRQMRREMKILPFVKQVTL